MKSQRLGHMLKQHRFAALAAIGILVIGGSVAVYSGASFNYKTSNPANTFTAGNLSHSNSKDGAAILTADKMKPGQSTSGTVVITNNGDIDGVFSMAKGAVSQTAGPNGGQLYSVLDLKIVDVTVPSSPVTKYDGDLNAFTGLDSTALGGTWTPGTARTYEFTVTFPDGGTPGSNTTGDNQYKSSSCTVEFLWTSVQS